jgi:hypothetical protein
MDFGFREGAYFCVYGTLFGKLLQLNCVSFFQSWLKVLRITKQASEV